MADVVVLVRPGAVGLLLEVRAVLHVDVLDRLPLVLDARDLINLKSEIK